MIACNWLLLTEVQAYNHHANVKVGPSGCESVAKPQTDLLKFILPVEAAGSNTPFTDASIP